MEKILILGGSGLVGRALINELKDKYEVYATYYSTLTSLPVEKQFKLEVNQLDKLKEILNSTQPDIVISCLRGDFERQLKFHKELALNLVQTRSRVYYLSTTNVFDGDFSKPHLETDPPIAESDYGKYKIECENVLKEILGKRTMIIRIPAIWGKNSQRWNMIIESIKEQKMIEVYSNLVCNNLLDIQLARQLVFIIENGLKGVFHLGSVDMLTQSQFFEQILSKLGGSFNLRYNPFQDHGQTYYFALETNRNDIPDFLHITNNEIISYLLG
ncbi:sugar nucleotide-binding protein [Neobacillus vireti]|uniref:sugar nucleotide-binding protein n=1 Tax=Neobacillus vireti TaxID=220686 RepID=UPI0030003D49